MDTLFGIALVGLWIVISVVALSRAFSFARISQNGQLSNQTSCAKICGRPVAVHPGFGVNATTFA